MRVRVCLFHTLRWSARFASGYRHIVRTRTAAIFRVSLRFMELLQGRKMTRSQPEERRSRYRLLPGSGLNVQCIGQDHIGIAGGRL
jgi:hypothetical protein